MEIMKDLIDSSKKNELKKYEKETSSTVYYAQNLKDMIGSNLEELVSNHKNLRILVDSAIRYSFSNRKSVDIKREIKSVFQFFKPFVYDYPTLEIEASDSISAFESTIYLQTLNMIDYFDNIDNFGNLYSNMSLFHYFSGLNKPELMDIYNDKNLRLKKKDSKSKNKSFANLPIFSPSY